MKKNRIVPLLAAGIMAFVFLGCEAQPNQGDLAETEGTDQENTPMVAEVEETEDAEIQEAEGTEVQATEDTLPSYQGIGQGIPEGAVAWGDGMADVPPVGESTLGHNPENTQWTNWDGIAR